MTCYQDCHRHYGYLTHETTIARKLLERHGRPCPETVKELRNETDMSMAECADMLRCMWRDIELERLAGENAKLRELVEKLYGYYVSGTLTPCDFCDRYDCEGTAPTTCKADEYEPDGIVTKEIERLMRELGVEVDG